MNRRIPANLGESLAKKASRESRAARAAFRFERALPFGDALQLRSYRLENGLKLLVVPDHSAPVVSYMTWLDVGSRHEKPGKTGLAHLFEHLMFAGTEAHPAGEFDRLVEAAGAEANAATWVDWTHYYENLPASMLPLAIDLEADRLAHLSLDEKVVATEKDVVANERRYRVDDDVDGTAGEVLYATAFGDHPYAHPTIGSMRDIEAFTPRDCEAFHRTHYVPNRVTLVVVGDVDEVELLARVGRAYGKLEAGPRVRARPVPAVTQRRERRVSIQKPSASAKVAVGYRAPSMRDPEFAPLSVVNEVLFGGRSSRMHRALVHDSELCIDAHGSVGPFRDPGLHELWLTARPGVTPERALAALDVEIAKLFSEGVTEHELERAKSRFELSFLNSLETASGKAEAIGFHAVVAGDPANVHASLEATRAVTVADAMRVAKSTLRASKRTVVLVEPGKVSP